MGVRIASAAVCILLATLLVLTVRTEFGPPRVVEPTGGVTHGPQDDLPPLEESANTLQARTFLQRWRGVSGPSPDAAFEAAATAAQGDGVPDPAPEEEQ